MRTYADQLRYRLSRLLPNIPPSQHEDVLPRVEERLASARTAFVHGFQEALNAPPETLPLLLQNQPFQILGFALEGAAVAVVAG